MNVTATLINVILPVFILIGIGALTERWQILDVRTLSRSVLYVFVPALVFRSLLTTKLGARDAAQIVVFVLVTAGVLGIIAWAVTRALHLDALQANAFLLSVVLANTGNYGLPVSLFAFGEAGLEQAAVFFSVTSLLINTVGVYIAALGHADPTKALRNTFRLPLIYAVSLALALRGLGIVNLPTVIYRPLDVLADAAVPVLLLALGIQLATSTLDRQFSIIGLATVLRLVVAAAVSIVIARLMGLQGLTRQVCIVQSSMPTAILSVALAVEFNTQPRFVTSVVFTSTLASIATLTAVLSFIA